MGITCFLSLALLIEISVTAAIIVLCIAATGFAATMLYKRSRQTGVFPMAFFAVCLSCVLVLLTNANYFSPAKNLVGEDISLHARIVDLPREGEGRYYYTLKMADKDGIKLRLSCKTPLEATPYDYVDFKGTVYELGGNTETLRNYYISSGVSLGVYTFGDINITQSQSRPLFYHLLKLRAAIKSSVDSILPGENGGLVTALLLGDTSGLSAQTREAFSQTGVAHIFSVSGLHMSIWVMSVMALLEALKVRRKIAASISILFIFLIIGLTGFSVACMRSGFMYLIMLAGYFFKRKADPLNSLGFAILIIVIMSPYAAMSIGLQLSFLSTLGIICIYSPLTKPVFRRINPIGSKMLKAVLKVIAAGTCVTISAVVFTLPVMISTFGTVSLVTPLSNLLLNYSCSVAMITGGLGSLISFIPFLSFISNPLMLIAGAMSKYSLWCVLSLSKISFASIGVSDGYIFAWLAFSMLLFSFSVIIYKISGRSLIKLTSILCIIMLFAGMLSFNILNKDVTKITVIDSGNGTCILITKKSHAFMIGCGGDFFTASNAVKYIQSNSISSLDCLLIPRLTEYEYGRAAELIEHRRAEHYVFPELDSVLKYYGRTRNFTVTKNCEIELWNHLKCRYEYDQSYSYVFLDIDGTTVLCTFNVGCDTSKIPEGLKKSDILICRAQPPEGLNISGFSAVIVSAEAEKAAQVLNGCELSHTNVYATAGSGNIEIKSSGNSVFSVRRLS